MQSWDAPPPGQFVDEFAGDALVSAEKDSGVNNCWQFRIQHEDHTLGNMLTQKLLDEDRVLFAGYRIHHPMDDWIYIRVNVSDDITRPVDLVNVAINNLVTEINRLAGEFDKGVARELKKGETDGRYRP
jgi:DNA-directed RNA polymerase II subunit RPB11